MLFVLLLSSLDLSLLKNFTIRKCISVTLNLITDASNFLTRTDKPLKALENYTSEENSPEKKSSTWDSSGVPESQKLNFRDNGALY